MEKIKPYLLNWIYRNGKGGTPTPSKLQEKEIKITQNGTTTVTPDAGYDGLSSVTVQVQTAPALYTFVEYIENNNGTQTSYGSGHIVTDLNNNGANHIRYEFKFYWSPRSQTAIFGSYTNSANSGTFFCESGNDFSIWARGRDRLGSVDSSSMNEGYLDVNGSNWEAQTSPEGTIASGSNVDTSASFPSSPTLSIFTQNGNTTQRPYMKLYYFKAYNDGDGTYKLVRDYVPCIRNADYKIGLYDKVTDTFIEGTGTFTAGPAL